MNGKFDVPALHLSPIFLYITVKSMEKTSYKQTQIMLDSIHFLNLRVDIKVPIRVQL